MRNLTTVIESDCARCDRTMFPVTGGFVHDVRCWGWHTAFFNCGVWIKLVLGLD